MPNFKKNRGYTMKAASAGGPMKKNFGVGSPSKQAGWTKSKNLSTFGTTDQGDIDILTGGQAKDEVTGGESAVPQKKFGGAWNNPEYVDAMQDNSAKGQEWQDGETTGSAVPQTSSPATQTVDEIKTKYGSYKDYKKAVQKGHVKRHPGLPKKED